MKRFIINRIINNRKSELKLFQYILVSKRSNEFIDFIIKCVVFYILFLFPDHQLQRKFLVENCIYFVLNWFKSRNVSVLLKIIG